MSVESLPHDPEGKVVQFSGKGIIYSHTTVRDAPEGYKKFAPYPVAIIKLDEGPLITAGLTDPDPDNPFKIGMEVEMVTRKWNEDGDQGIINYGYKFRPPIRKNTQSDISAR